MRRVVLLLPTSSYRVTDFVRAAAAVDATVVVVSDEAPVMGDALVVDLDDPAAVAAAIRTLDDEAPIDAVLAVDDRGVVAAARAAEVLGLAHNPVDAVAATRDKAALRAALDVAEVPQPAWAAVAPGEVPDLPFPWVVKPRGLSGSTGVIRIDGPDDVAATFERVRRIAGDADASLLVERFVPGAEVAVEGLLRDGALEVLAVFDKPDPLDGPYFEETLYVTPSRHDVAPVTRLVQRACTALGLREGPVHAEARLGDHGPVLLEVAARSIGGLCSRALRFGAGVSLEELLLRHALGLPAIGPATTGEASGVLMLPIPRQGILQAVHGREDALAVPGVEGIDITIPPGREVVPLPEGDRYLGFVFARGATADDVESSLRAAQAALDVVIE